MSRDITALAGRRGVADRDMSETKTERIIRLAESQEWSSRACLARAVGATPELVRQVVNARGLTVRKVGSPRVELRWPCPECGEEIVRHRNAGKIKHMPAHCRPCADKYCWRGHRRTARLSARRTSLDELRPLTGKLRLLYWERLSSWSDLTLCTRAVSTDAAFVCLVIA